MARRLFFILLLISVQSFAQQTAIFVDPESQYRTGLDLFVKQKYAAAQKEFFSVAKSEKNISSNTRGNAVYFSAKCAAELFHKDAEYLLVTFINDYPENVNLQAAIYDLGLFYYCPKPIKRQLNGLRKWISPI